MRRTLITAMMLAGLGALSWAGGNEMVSRPLVLSHGIDIGGQGRQGGDSASADESRPGRKAFSVTHVPNGVRPGSGKSRKDQTLSGQVGAAQNDADPPAGTPGAVSGQQSDHGGPSRRSVPKPPDPFIPEIPVGRVMKPHRAELSDIPRTLKQLPLAPVQLARLAEGERYPYQVFLLTHDGGLRVLGRLHALLQVRYPRGGEKTKKIRDGKAVFISGDEHWAPLIVDGRMVGTLVTWPVMAMNFDPDGDGVVDLRVVQESGVEHWMVLDTPGAWDFFKEMLEAGSACDAVSAMSRRRKGGLRAPGGFVDSGPGIELCSSPSGASGVGRTGTKRNRWSELSDGCKRLLGSGRCPVNRRVGGWAADPSGDELGDYVWDELKEEPLEQMAEHVVQRLFGRVVGGLFGVAGAVKDIGDFLRFYAHTDYRDHYVNEADKVLHNFEGWVRDHYDSVEAAERDGIRPDPRILESACGAGSTSTYCGGSSALGERDELPEEKKRSLEYWRSVANDGHIDGSKKGEGPGEQPGRAPEGPAGSRSPLQVRCDACRAEAAYKRRLRDVMDQARSRCSDARSQPQPSALRGQAEGQAGGGVPAPDPQGAWWGGVAGPSGEIACRVSEKGSGSRTRPPTLEDFVKAATGCSDPTARPLPEGENAGRSPRCRFRKGVNAQVPTIGISFGAVIGFGPCPEKTCQGRPES